MSKTHIFFLPLIYCSAWVVFFIQGVVSLDPDFGWHLKAGELAQKGLFSIPDPFSYTMPGYTFIDHEWLTDLVTFKVYPFTGNIGLSFIYASFTLLSLILVTPKTKWAIIPLILSSSLLFSFAGIRPQIISWFFTAVILKISLVDNLWQRWRFILPFIFIIWANLHGGFVLGLGIIFLIILCKIWQVKKFLLSDSVILIASFSGTLINPHGILIWKEIVNQITDVSLKWSIAEWVSPFYFIDITFLLLLAMSLVLITKHYKGLSFKYLTLYIILLLIGFSSVRNVPFWVLINIPVIAFCFKKFSQEAKKDPSSWKRFNISLKALLLIVIAVSVFSIFTTFKNSLLFPAENVYPAKAISFLRSYPRQGEIFAPYDWGGYLIWKYPEKKVFIDGRMPSWKWDPPSTSESGNAYKEYRDIIFKGGNFNQTFNRYNVHTVLWSVMSYLEPKKPKSFTQRLEEAGWKRVYSDDVAVIYEK